MRFGSLFPVPLPDKTAPFPLQVPVGAVVVPVGCLFFPGPFFSPPALCVSFSYVHLRYYTSSLMQRFGFLILHERHVRVGLREFGILKQGGSVCFGQSLKNKGKMFCFRMSYLAVLQAVAQHCCLSYVSVIRQTVEDGTNLYGVELQLPQHAAQGPSGTTLFFWAPPGLPASSAYETASLQALVHLQATFGFIIADYSIHGLLLYRNLARHLFPIANRAIHLARLVIATSSDAGAPCPLLLAVAQQLIDQVGSVPDGMVF